MSGARLPRRQCRLKGLSRYRRRWNVFGGRFSATANSAKNHENAECQDNTSISIYQHGFFFLLGLQAAINCFRRRLRMR